VAITNLSRRLAKLEGRFDVGREPIVHVIKFVDVDGRIESTLTLTHGGRGVAAPVWRHSVEVANESTVIA
jgi:hypothetical protein